MANKLGCDLRGTVAECRGLHTQPAVHGECPGTPYIYGAASRRPRTSPTVPESLEPTDWVKCSVTGHMEAQAGILAPALTFRFFLFFSFFFCYISSKQLTVSGISNLSALGQNMSSTKLMLENRVKIFSKENF